MAFGCNGLRARLGERRGRREFSLVYGIQEKRLSHYRFTVNNRSAHPHPDRYPAEAQENAFFLRALCNHGLVRLILPISHINFTSPRAQRHCHHDILVISNKGIYPRPEDCNPISLPSGLTNARRIPCPSRSVRMCSPARSWPIRRYLSLVDSPRVKEKVKFL